MKSQQGIQTTKQQASAGPVFVEAEKLFEQLKEFSQSVARRAYEYFEARGREFGHDLEDWFRAESELMRRVPVEVKMEYSPAIAEKSLSRGRECPFLRAFAMAEPHDAYGKAIAQQKSNRRM